MVLSGLSGILCKRAPYIHKSAPYIHKRAPYIHKRAQYIHKRAPYIHKRAPYIHKRAQYLRQTALYMRKIIQPDRWSFWVSQGTCAKDPTYLQKSPIQPQNNSAKEPYICAQQFNQAIGPFGSLRSLVQKSPMYSQKSPIHPQNNSMHNNWLTHPPKKNCKFALWICQKPYTSQKKTHIPSICQDFFFTFFLNLPYDF